MSFVNRKIAVFGIRQTCGSIAIPSWGLRSLIALSFSLNYSEHVENGIACAVENQRELIKNDGVSLLSVFTSSSDSLIRSAAANALRCCQWESQSLQCVKIVSW